MVEHLRVTFRGNSSEQLSHRGIICSKQPAVNAEQKQDEKSPVSAMMSAFGGGMMMNIDTSMIEQRMVIEADTSLDAEQKKAQVAEMQKANLEAKVSRFDGILSAPQQKQYRQSLESQNSWMRNWGGRRGR